jgi:hypothetical protein
MAILRGESAAAAAGADTSGAGRGCREPTACPASCGAATIAPLCRQSLPIPASVCAAGEQGAALPAARATLQALLGAVAHA